MNEEITIQKLKELQMQIKTIVIFTTRLEEEIDSLLDELVSKKHSLIGKSKKELLSEEAKKDFYRTLKIKH